MTKNEQKAISIRNKIAQCDEKIQKETQTKKELLAELETIKAEIVAKNAKKISADTQKQIDAINLIAESGLTLEELSELLGKPNKQAEQPKTDNTATELKITEQKQEEQTYAR